MITYYVSLAQDLVGCYLEYQSVSEESLRCYLRDKYLVGAKPNDIWSGVWKLPWCSIYRQIPDIDKGRAVVIKACCGPIVE